MSNSHYFLAGSYQLNRLLYSLSFKERIGYDLGHIKFCIAPSKELLALSDEELLAKIKSLKAPWWNSIYEKKVVKNQKLLSVFYILLNLKSYGFQAPRLLYTVIRSKE